MGPRIPTDQSIWLGPSLNNAGAFGWLPEPRLLGEHDVKSAREDTSQVDEQDLFVQA